MAGQAGIFMRNVKIYSIFIFIIIFLNMPYISQSGGAGCLAGSRAGFAIPAELSPPEIIFDEAHMQLWSIWDTGFVGYSDLAMELRADGYRVSANTRNLADSLATCQPGDVLVLGNAIKQNYTVGEVASIVRFVESGGGLLIMSEHEKPDASPWFLTTMQNPVSENFGIHFNSDEIDDVGNSIDPEGIWLLLDVDVLDVDDVCLFLGNSMTLSGNAEALAETGPLSSSPFAPVVAMSTRGAGRVIAVTDTEFIWNGDDSIGLSYANNSLFAKRIFSWLSGADESQALEDVMPEYDLITADEFDLNVSVSGPVAVTVASSGAMVSPESVDDADGMVRFHIVIESDGYVAFQGAGRTAIVHLLKPGDESRTRALFDGRFGCRNVDDSQSGMLSFACSMRDAGIDAFSSRSGADRGAFDTVFVVNPLAAMEGFEISPGARYVLLSEAYTWPWSYYSPGESAQPPRGCPLNEAASELGLDFAYYSVMDPAEPSQVESFNPEMQHAFGFCYTSYRCGLILNTTDMTVLAQARPGAWSELVDVWDTQPYAFDPVDYTVTYSAMYDWKVLGMADTDPLTNAHIPEPGAGELADSIIGWAMADVAARESNGLFGSVSSLTARAPTDAVGVDALMPDGAHVNLTYDPDKGCWAALCPPMHPAAGANATVLFNVSLGGSAFYLLEVPYETTSATPAGYYALAAAAAVVGAAAFMVLYRRKHGPSGKE